MTTSCIDLNFADEGFAHFTVSYGPNNFDTYVVPGPSLALSMHRDASGRLHPNDPIFFAAWLETLMISRLLHGTTVVELCDHERCGYFRAREVRGWPGVPTSQWPAVAGYSGLSPEEKKEMHVATLARTIADLAEFLRGHGDPLVAHPVGGHDVHWPLTITASFAAYDATDTRPAKVPEPLPALRCVVFGHSPDGPDGRRRPPAAAQAVQ